MFKAFSKIHRTSNFEILKPNLSSNYMGIINKPFSTEKSSNTSKPQAQNHFCKHQQAFKNLQSKLNVGETQENLKKFAFQNSMESIKQKLYENFSFGKDKKEKLSQQDKAQEVNIKASFESLKAVHEQAEQQIVKEETLKAEEVVVEVKGPSFQERISAVIAEAPVVGKVLDYITESWEQTFPNDRFKKKASEVKRKAKENAAKKAREYTEEELEEMQGSIPEWKRTALIHLAEEMQEKPSVKRQVINAIADRVNQTKLAQDFYQSEEYKDMQEVRRELLQFKEDCKDHMHHSQSPVAIASMAIYSNFTTESNTARAINETRKLMPGFDMYELERDARGVFCQIYDAFLEGNLEFIEKTCGESALVYFRTLLKKREAEGVYPQHSTLWDAEGADLIGGKISAENSQACFSFTIRVQEVYCNISKKTNKIVDGGEDRVIQNRFNFVLTMHDNPDFELSGHPWELVEVLPIEAVHMLA